MPADAMLLSVDAAAAHAFTVLVCTPVPHQQARVRDALRGRARVQFVQSLEQLSRILRARTATVDVVVLPGQEPDHNTLRMIQEIAAEFPRLAIVAYCRAGSQYSGDLRALAAAGVHQFAFLGIDDTGVAFRNVLETARQRCAADWLMDAFARVVPVALHPVVEAILAKPHAITTVTALANALGVHRKTLFNRCERAHFLPPGELLAWARLAVVAYLLERTECTIQTIANDLSFASDTALRNIVKRYTGLRASDIRANGGTVCFFEAFNARLHQAPDISGSLHVE
jgi:AraC-like DNA-binding protein